VKLGRLFRRGDPTVRTSCDGGDFAWQAIAAGLSHRTDPERTGQPQGTEINPSGGDPLEGLEARTKPPESRLRG
jgi:hypothetical protein